MVRQRAGSVVAAEGVSPAAAAAGLFQIAATKKFGEEGLISTDDFFDSVYGVPLTGNLPLQYLFGLDVIPMERSIAVVGKEASGKSVFCWFLASLMMKSATGSLVVFYNMEHKQNPDQIRGVLQNDSLWDAVAIQKQATESLETMLDSMDWYGNYYTQVCPGHDIPIVFLIDSLGAATSNKNIQKAKGELKLKKGASTAPGYDPAHNANLLTQRLKAFQSGHMDGKPMLLLTVNHLKDSMEETAGNFQQKKTNSPGGAHKDFIATYTVVMGQGKTSSTFVEATAGLWLSTKKSGFTKLNQRIWVPMYTKHTNEKYEVDLDLAGGGEDIQRKLVHFDWDTALISLLTDDKLRPCSQEDVTAITGLKKDGAKCSSSVLGLKGISVAEMGNAIHDNPEVTRKLQDAFNVMRKRKLTPVV